MTGAGKVMHMEKYRFDDERQSFIEGMQVPFAVYQFVDKRVVTIALSEGFCKMLGYEDFGQAYFDMDHDMYKCTHPDDVTRVAILFSTSKHALIHFVYHDCDESEINDYYILSKYMKQ